MKTVVTSLFVAFAVMLHADTMEKVSESSQEKTVEWYQAAAEEGVAEAQYYLGVMYTKGNYVEKNIDMAVYWYKKAALQGVKEAQLNLGYMYETGNGVKQDYGEAIQWYERAAQQGDTAAMNNLGIIYMMGKGVSESRANRKKAYDYFRVAAKNGNDAAWDNIEKLRKLDPKACRD